MSKYVEVNKLIEIIKAHQYLLADSIGSKDYGMFTVGIKQAVEEAEAEDVKPVVHAHWKIKYVGNLFVAQCSRCDFGKGVDDLRYCPGCGAKMDE